MAEFFGQSGYLHDIGRGSDVPLLEMDLRTRRCLSFGPKNGPSFDMIVYI